MSPLTWILNLPKTKLFKKYLRSYLLISLIPILIISFVSILFILYVNLTNADKTVRSMLGERVERIKLFIDSKKHDAKVAAADPKMTSFFSNMQAVYKSGIKSEVYREKYDSYKEDIRNIVDDNDFYDGMLIDPKGNIIATSKLENDLGRNIMKGIDGNRQLDAAFSETLKTGRTAAGSFDYYAPSGLYAMFITSPIMEKGKIIAVLAFQLKNDEINALTQDNKGIGKTGEVVVGIKKGSDVLFINSLRRDTKAAFVRTVQIGQEHGGPIQQAVEGKTGSGILQDYDGTTVVSAWDYIPEVQWGVVIKRDLGEVVEPAISLGLLFIVFGFAAFLVALMLAVKTSEETTKPIVSLAEAARRAAAGDLQVKAEANTKDELDDMAESFNSMVSILKEQLKKIENYLDVSEALIAELDKKGTIINVNNMFLKILGYTKDELLGRNWFDVFVHTSQKEFVQAPFEKMMAGTGENIEYFENELLTKSGEARTIYWHNTVNRDDAGKIVSTLSSGMDITRVKKIEQGLTRAEARYKAAFEQAAVGVVDATSKGVLLNVNSEFCRITGYNPEELAGKSFGLITHPDDVKKDVEMIAKVEAGEIPCYSSEKRYIRKDGSVIWAHVNVSPVVISGRISHFFIVVEDISQRKAAEAALEESEARFKSVFEKSAAGMSLTAADGKLLKVNGSLARMFGYTVDEMHLKNFSDITHPDDVADSKKQINYLLSGEKKTVHFEKRYIHKNGSIVWTDLSSTLFKGANGKPLYLITSIIDITEKKKMQEEVIESEKKFRSAFEQSAVGMVYCTPEGVFSKVNGRFCEMTGYSQDEITKLNFRDITHPEDVDMDVGYAEKLLSGEMDSYSLEKRYIKKTGEVIWIRLFTNMLRNDDGSPKSFVGVIEDVTERKKAQQELSAAVEELKRSNSDLEQFAYISSHDLQEPLRSIAGYLQLIDRKYRDKLDAEGGSYINSTIAAAERMKTLINDVLQYSKIEKKGEPFAPADMNEAVAQAMLNLEGAIERNKVKVIYSKLPVAFVDFGQMVRLFQNFIGNSIKFRNQGEDPVIEITCRENARDYIFKVKDNGIGIDPQYSERIFAIFQRLHSRREYPGTGIGLAVCKKIVERHGGKIWLESEPGKGAEFYFTIPSRR